MPETRKNPGLQTAVRIARGQHGLITSEQAAVAGLTREQLRHLVRTGTWLRARTGIYVLPAAAEIQREDGPWRVRIRAALLARPGVVVCGLTAGRLLGLGGLPRQVVNEPIHVLLATRGSRRQTGGMVTHFGSVHPAHLVEVDGITLTGPDRTLADLVLASPRDEAVAMMDAALRGGHVRNLDKAMEATADRPGARRVAPFWPLADGRAESPLETRLRLLLRDAGLPPPSLQWPVADDAGRIRARLDLAWPEAMLDVEADGVAVHDQPPALHRDRDRQHWLMDRGWMVRRVTWQDVLDRPGPLVAAVTRWLLRGLTAERHTGLGSPLPPPVPAARSPDGPPRPPTPPRTPNAGRTPTSRSPGAGRCDGENIPGSWSRVPLRSLP